MGGMDRFRRDPEENIGSRARDHLANERTFLAWVRTALGMMGLGVIVGKLVETEGILAEVIGLVMVAFGAAMLIYSVVRYERVTALLGEGRFAAAEVGPLVLAGLGIVIAAGSVVLLVT